MKGCSRMTLLASATAGGNEPTRGFNTQTLASGPHLPAVGPLPPVDELLVCALLYSPSPAVVQIAEYIDAAADLGECARRAYCALVELALQNNSPAPQLVLDELRRTGRLDRQTACWLAAAATAGAPPASARRYAAIVVANSLRRHVNSWGSALTSAAYTAAEDELQVTIDSFAHTIATIFARLAVLRGDTRG
jgi:replicative DNA helicase